MCDLLIAFCKQLEDNPLLRPLVCVPNSAIQQTLIDFIRTYVFVDKENQDENDQIEELHKRRRYFDCVNCKCVSLRETLLTVIFPLQVIVWFLQACLLQRTAC